MKNLYTKYTKDIYIFFGFKPQNQENEYPNQKWVKKYEQTLHQIFICKWKINILKYIQYHVP